jgi:iron complex transport system substrate-binding protein
MSLVFVRLDVTFMNDVIWWGEQYSDMHKPKDVKFSVAWLINLVRSMVSNLARALFLVLVVALITSSYAQERPKLSSERQPIEVRRGPNDEPRRLNEVELNDTQRIISLAPHITELLFAVGAGDEIVGTVSYSDYPIRANEIPRIGSHNKFNYEAILALRPTLVIGWDSGNGDESLNRIKQLELRVYSFESRSLDEVASSLSVLGELTGNAKQGDVQASLFRQRVNTIKKQYSKVKPVSVYYQLWNEPQMTVNDKHLISDVIRLCGGRNIFADAASLIPKVGIESIVRRAPEVIIAASASKGPPKWLDDWRNWSSIPAVKNNHLYYVQSDLLHRHSSRILDGADQVCEILSTARQLMVGN